MATQHGRRTRLLREWGVWRVSILAAIVNKLSGFLVRANTVAAVT